MSSNIYSQISANKTKSILIMASFIAFVGVLGYILGETFAGYGYGTSYMLTAFIFSTVSAIFSYYYSDKMVLSMSGAKKLNREDNERLYGLLENLSIGAGLKKVPDLYLIQDNAMNAFATGRDPSHASIAVTAGLIEKLDKRELEGVLAHELAHVKNYDIRLMAITAVLVGVVSLIANLMLNSAFYGGRSSDDDNKRGGFGVIGLIFGFVLALLSPVIAQLIQLAVSRSREYLADSSAALLTRDPKGLADALRKIGGDRHVLNSANEATEHLFISNPLKKGFNGSVFSGLFNTHPPIEERIKRLESM